MIEVLFIALVIGVVATWWWFPRWQLRKFYAGITDAAEQADAEDKFRRTLSQVLGGGVLLAGLALSFQEIQSARQATESARASADQATESARETSRAQIEALTRQQISQQFSKGVELLGEGTLAERLGGIYTLEQVAQRSETYHWPVMETLTSYVRSSEASEVGLISTEVQAALTVIGRRKLRKEPGLLNLSKVFLAGANLTKAFLSEANLTGADLLKANLSEANLSDANLTKAFLSEANLTGANLSEADLSEALNLSQGQLDQACGDDETKLPGELTIKLCEPGAKP